MTVEGNCFEHAAKIVLGWINGVPSGKRWLVHGLPVGQGAENFGLRYWHAWVEINVAGVPMVYDLANNRNIVMSRTTYYRLGQIDKIYRYDRKQTIAHVREHGQWGPWVDGWETLDDELNTKENR